MRVCRSLIFLRFPCSISVSDSVSLIEKAFESGIEAPFWIGANDLRREMQFVTAKGKGLKWSNWELNQPEADQNKNCAEINYQSKWNVTECDHKGGSINYYYLPFIMFN